MIVSYTRMQQIFAAALKGISHVLQKFLLRARCDGQSRPRRQIHERAVSRSTVRPGRQDTGRRRIRGQALAFGREGSGTLVRHRSIEHFGRQSGVIR